MRYLTVAAVVLLAACGDSSTAEGEYDSGIEISVTSTDDEVPDDLFIECSLPMGEPDEEFAMTETRSFIAYEGALRNYSSMDEGIADNCSPARDGCRDTLEDGVIVSERTAFSGDDERTRVLRVDTETLATSLHVLDGDNESPLDIEVTCERSPYPATVNPPSRF